MPVFNKTSNSSPWTTWQPLEIESSESQSCSTWFYPGSHAYSLSSNGFPPVGSVSDFLAEVPEGESAMCQQFGRGGEDNGSSSGSEEGKNGFIGVQKPRPDRRADPLESIRRWGSARGNSKLSGFWSNFSSNHAFNEIWSEKGLVNTQQHADVFSWLLDIREPRLRPSLSEGQKHPAAGRRNAVSMTTTLLETALADAANNPEPPMPLSLTDLPLEILQFLCTRYLEPYEMALLALAGMHSLVFSPGFYPWHQFQLDLIPKKSSPFGLLIRDLAPMVTDVVLNFDLMSPPTVSRCTGCWLPDFPNVTKLKLVVPAGRRGVDLGHLGGKFSSVRDLALEVRSATDTMTLDCYSCLKPSSWHPETSRFCHCEDVGASNVGNVEICTPTFKSLQMLAISSTEVGVSFLPYLSACATRRLKQLSLCLPVPDASAPQRSDWRFFGLGVSIEQLERIDIELVKNSVSETSTGNSSRRANRSVLENGPIRAGSIFSELSPHDSQSSILREFRFASRVAIIHPPDAVLFLGRSTALRKLTIALPQQKWLSDNVLFALKSASLESVALEFQIDSTHRITAEALKHLMRLPALRQLTLLSVHAYTSSNAGLGTSSNPVCEDFLGAYERPEGYEGKISFEFYGPLFGMAPADISRFAKRVEGDIIVL